ncbi:hypothetical protein VaNZ11_005183 [Volvox africanus]|uniref:AB hydrolase-1 domain-containing protein n=1 Tax=Volvox africanus TaxID=51714 RepID=A0ABQ5RYD2_9CHLO|nr:hypothetical protein VaNZ11_005183 [Volvox africanus]
MTVGNSSLIWQRFCAVGGIITELWGINASAGKPRLQVVVFPGNPGSAEYFKPFMLAVHRQLQGHADVLAVTHAGHDPETSHGGRLWDLQQQISHKVAFLREHVLLPGRPPVLLVGHSIGANMMIKAVAQIEGLSATFEQQQQQQQLKGELAAAKGQESEGWRPNPLTARTGASMGAPGPGGAAAIGRMATSGAREGLPAILKLVAVFPFFETNIGGSWRQRRLRALAPWYDYLGWVGAAVTSMPRFLRLAFVRLNADMDSSAVDLTSRLLSRHIVRNAFYLASHEFKDLSKPWDWALLAAFGRRLHVMGCEADTWLSRRQFNDMLARVPGLQATWHPELRHAFCTSERQSAAVAEAVAAVVQSIPDLDLDLDLDLDVLPSLEEVVDLAGDMDLPFPSQPISRANSSETNASSVGAIGPVTGCENILVETPTAMDGSTSCLSCRVICTIHDSHQYHNHQPHDDQLVPCGQTSQQRRELYGDDVVVGTQCPAVAAGCLAGAGGSSSADTDGDVDETADQSADPIAAMYDKSSSAKTSASSSTVAVAATSGGSGDGQMRQAFLQQGIRGLHS